MGITARKAQAVAVELHDRVWNEAPGANEFVVDHAGQVYIITTGTDDGTYAYNADSVLAWLDETEGGKPKDAAQGFLPEFKAAVPAVAADKALAEAAQKEWGVLVCAPGTKTPVLG